MKKRQINLHLEDEVSDRLDLIGERYNNMSKNTLLSIVASEFSRVPAAEFWAALARVNNGTLPPPNPPKPPRIKKSATRQESAAPMVTAA